MSDQPRFVMPPLELFAPEAAAQVNGEAVAQEATPTDVLAERATIGAILTSADALSAALGIVQPDDFADQRHAVIARTAFDLYAEGQPATDWLLILNRIKPDDLADSAPLNDAYLRSLVAGTPDPGNVEGYARIVRSKAIGRRLVRAGQRITQVGRDVDGTDIDKAAKAAGILADATGHGGTADKPQPVGDNVDAVLDLIRDGQAVGPSTGLADLDTLTYGLAAGLWVVGARPGIGKSVLLCDVARSIAVKQGLPAMLFTLEMSKVEVIMRLLAAEARVPLHVLKRGRDHVGPDDWARLNQARMRLAAAPLLIDDTTDISATDIAVKVRSEHAARPLTWVGVDYLQLVRPEGTGRRDANREQEIAASTRSLKVLQGDLGINLTVAAQLNRGPEQRADKRPGLADLRESGSIEANANVVILLHRPDYYDPESPRAGEVDLIVAKNRDGATDTVTAAAQLHLARFADMAVI